MKEDDTQDSEIVPSPQHPSDNYKKNLIARFLRSPNERIIGYYQSIDDTVNNTSFIRKFDIDIAVADQNDPTEDLIPAISTAGTHETIIELHKNNSLNLVTWRPVPKRGIKAIFVKNMLKVILMLNYYCISFSYIHK